MASIFLLQPLAVMKMLSHIASTSSSAFGWSRVSNQRCALAFSQSPNSFLGLWPRT